MPYASRLLLVCLLPALLLGACNEVDLPAPSDQGSRIVLYGELIAGDSLHIRGGRSHPLKDARGQVRFEQDMQISCSSANGTISLAGYEDDLLYAAYTSLFSNPGIVAGQTAYRIKAAAPGLEPAEASVQVPAAFSGSVVPDGLQQVNGDSMLAFKVLMQALPAGSRYVAELLITDAAINASFQYGGVLYSLNADRRLYDSLVDAGVRVDVQRDTIYSGSLSRQIFFTDRISSENVSPGINRPYYWFFLKPEGQTALAFRMFLPLPGSGTHLQYTIRLKSVSPDYYDYLKAYELDNLLPGDVIDGNLKSTTATGNVKGGFGIVGGVYLQERRFFH